MPVIGIFAHAYISNDLQMRTGILDKLDGLLYHPIITVSTAAAAVFMLGDTEQQHRRYAQGVNLLDLPGQLIHRQLENPGHGLNRTAYTLAVVDKQRVDQLFYR